MRIGVLGCGSVSGQYFPNLVDSPVLDLVAVADIDGARAAETAAEWGTIAVTPDELIADPAIELVLNLTPIVAHVATTRALLAAGKHVYSEKSLAPTAAEAAALVAEAQQRGVVLAVAPDTLLGSGFSAARESFVAGEIGRPLFATATMVRASRAGAIWYTDGLMPLLDMAPYSVSALVSLFGDVVAVQASTVLWPTKEVPEERPAGVQLGAHAVLHFANGAHAALTLAWAAEPRGGEYTDVSVYGSRGILHLPNPNNFGDPAFITRFSADRSDEFVREEIAGSRRPQDAPRDNLRGIGAAEAALAVRSGQPARCSASLAVHVVEVIRAIEASGASGERVVVSSHAEIAPMLSAAGRAHLLPGVAGVPV